MKFWSVIFLVIAVGSAFGQPGPKTGRGNLQGLSGGRKDLVILIPCFKIHSRLNSNLRLVPNLIRQNVELSDKLKCKIESCEPNLIGPCKHEKMNTKSDWNFLMNGSIDPEGNNFMVIQITFGSQSDVMGDPVPIRALRTLGPTDCSTLIAKTISSRSAEIEQFIKVHK